MGIFNFLKPKKEVRPEEIGVKLADFILNPNVINTYQETIRRFPIEIDANTLETEVICLRLFAVDFVIPTTLDKRRRSDLIQEVWKYYRRSTIETLEQTGSGGERVLDVLEDRINGYSGACQSGKNWAVRVGLTFSDYCGYSENDDLAKDGQVMLWTDMQAAKKLINSMI